MHCFDNGVVDSEHLPLNISHNSLLQDAAKEVSWLDHQREQMQSLHELPGEEEPSEADVANAAAELGYTSALENLSARREAAGVSSCRLLRALVAADGLVNKAKRLLHSAM